MIWLHLRLKGIRMFEEEGENILNRVVSEEERMVPQEINCTKILGYDNRQVLYEALPVINKEMDLLQNENDDKTELYTTQKSEFTAGLHCIIDQIDRILRKDDERRLRAIYQY